MASGKSYESGIDNIPGAGRVAWQVEVTKNASGKVYARVIQSLRDLEADRPFGREDNRYDAAARFLNAM